MKDARLPSMSTTFYEAFWATVGAAAPVIALASIVSTTDATSMEIALRYPDEDIQQVRPEGPSAEKLAAFIRLSARKGRRAIVIARGAALSNLVIQTFALAYALLSLARHGNAITPWLFVFAEPVGLILLAFSSMQVILLRGTFNLMEKARTGKPPIP
jgi:hypothetical protein